MIGRLAETAGERLDDALLVAEVRHDSKTLAADRYVLRATAGGVV